MYRTVKNVIGLSVLFCLLVCMVSFAQAAWKEKVSRNQMKVTEYVAQLKDGADPDKLERPHLRSDSKYQAKLANKEMRQIMEEAEELARKGKHKQIELPEFTHRGLSEERAEDMLGEKKPAVKE